MTLNFPFREVLAPPAAPVAADPAPTGETATPVSTPPSPQLPVVADPVIARMALTLRKKAAEHSRIARHLYSAARDLQKSAPADTLTVGTSQHPTDIAKLMGARLVSAVETEEGRLWAEAKIKQMTGGDALVLRLIVASRPSVCMPTNTDGIEPKEVAAVIVVSTELLNFSDPTASELFSAELRNACGSAVDAEFATILDAASAATVTAANTPREDIRDALAALTISRNSRLAWVGATDVATAASTAGSKDTLLFPTMTPTGGTLAGIPFYPSDAVASGVAYLVDASRIAGNSDEFTFQVYKEANVQLSDTPDSPAIASTVLVNLWQENKAALIARAYFGAEVAGGGAVVKVTGANLWGSGVDSPA